MCGRQSLAAFVEGQSGEQAGILCVYSCSSIDPVLGEDGLNPVPKGLVHDGLMLSRMGVALVRDLAAIDAVLQHEVEGAAGELVTAIDSPVREGAVFAADSRSVEFCFKGTHRSEFDIRLAGVDGATQVSSGDASALATYALAVPVSELVPARTRPKKRGPDQWTPVIFLAIFVRDE
jgi:hypothetical protein